MQVIDHKKNILLTAWNDSGGGYLMRLLDHSSQINVLPFETLLGINAYDGIQNQTNLIIKGNSKDLTTTVTSQNKKGGGGMITGTDEDDDGENINEEDVELGKTLSFIKCKPSLVKSNRDNMNDRQVVSMTH